MKASASIAVLAASIALTVPAHAASDYLLEIDGIKGEAAESAQVASWSFGVCNSGQCTASSTKREIASGKATGKRAPGSVSIQASQNTQTLRESPTRASTGRSGVATGAGAAAGGPAVAVGDLDGDGLADLAYAGTLPEVSSLTLSFDKASPLLAKLCAGKHIAKATLRSASDSFELTEAMVSCTSSLNSTLEGGRAIDSTPARISTNVTVAKQTQSQSFGERCDSACTSSEGVTMTFTNGQLRHTKTGHVTLLK